MPRYPTPIARIVPSAGSNRATVQPVPRNEDIAERLFLCSRPIESHLRRMFDRYGVMNRTELAVLALKEGWVSAG